MERGWSNAYEEKRLAKEEAAKLESEKELSNKKEQFERELKSINEGIDFSKYRESIESMQIELVLFGTWANLIEEGENSDNPELKSLAKKLKSKVINIQTTEFPKLRKEYAKVVAKKMWENDIKVSANGTGSRYINFTGGIFAANKNKQDFQNQLHEVLTMFRFKQSRYRWYKGEDEYTYWTIYEGKDTDLVKFDK